MNRKPVLIDCDTGTDDAIALIAALHSPELEIRAITTVAGNAALEHTSRNTLNLTRYLGFDVKVAVGAPKPILRPEIIRSDKNIHGATGLGTLTLPETSHPFYEKTAIETIYEQALACSGKLVLIPTGPLSNIALAILAHPDLKSLVSQIVFMGGAKIGGNVTTTVEFNMWADPEAARIVFASGIPLTMVGLDVTSRTAMSAQDAAEIRAMGSRAAAVTADILDFMLEQRPKIGEKALMHDALAVGVCINPALVTACNYFVDCECSGEYTSGHTMVAAAEILGKEPNCTVAESLDTPAFKAWLKGAIARSVNQA